MILMGDDHRLCRSPGHPCSERLGFLECIGRLMAPPLLGGSEDSVNWNMCCALEMVRHHRNARNYDYGIELA